MGYLRKEKHCAMTTSQKKRVLPAGKIGIWHCTAFLFSKVPEKCTDLDLSLLYILTLGTYSKFARNNNFLALGVCFPQFCSSAGRRFAASRSRYKTTDESFRFHNNDFDEMPSKLGGIWADLSGDKFPAKLLTLQSPGGLLRAMNTDSKVLFHENTEFITYHSNS